MSNRKAVELYLIMCRVPLLEILTLVAERRTPKRVLLGGKSLVAWVNLVAMQTTVCSVEVLHR